MKLISQLDGQNIEIELEKTESGLTAAVDGRVYMLEASAPEPNVYLLKHNNTVYEVYVSSELGPAKPVNVKVRDHEFEISVSDPRSLRGVGTGANSFDGVSELKTAMPGKVVRILTKKGEEVLKGDGIIVVEAMKMQNEMKSPRDGLVKEIRFNEGDTVNAGDILAVID
ncbi:MAG: biotin/lipoyl-containing protein [Pyrinomonadaceae bacterium]